MRLGIMHSIRRIVLSPLRTRRNLLKSGDDVFVISLPSMLSF